VVWDYHVFVIEAAHGRLRRARVWDLDTRLPFPCSLDDYTHAALRPVRAPYGRQAVGGGRQPPVLLWGERRALGAAD
jgi:hypothetical protein